jgi:phenylpropionate dioxygenase-like ring-hydroxylating dioxygenase large terminal subunit
MRRLRLENQMTKEHWFIACASSRVGRGPHACRVHDQEIVVYRTARGEPCALVDRCCHRSAKLSLGRIVGESLACRYHGWSFDGTGRCTDIPSLLRGARIPEAVRVRSFPCREQNGYVWVWLGEGEPGPLMPLPFFADRKWVQGQMALRCHYMKGVENNIDWCHAIFAHRWRHVYFFVTLIRGLKEQQYELRTTETGIVAFTPVTATADAPMPAKSTISVRFDLPDRTIVQFRGRRIHHVLFMHYVPTGANSCRLEWMFSKLIPTGPRVTWTDAELLVLKQDQAIVESAQSAEDLQGTLSVERSVEADTLTLAARRVAELDARGEWNEKRSTLPSRRIVTIRN